MVNVCTVQTIPPTPMGGYPTEGERLGVPDRAATAYAAALAAHRAALSPCSNTGRILESGSDAPAFVDYLKFTLRGLRRVLTRVRRERPAPDGLDELRAVLFDTARGDWDVTDVERRQASALLQKIDCTGCLSMEAVTGMRLDRGLAVIAKTMIAAVAPALVFGELTGRGIDGYTNHLKIFTHLGEQCGHIAVGGNAETVHVNLTGQACQRIDMRKLADALEGMDYRIGRIDAAWDDFEGRYGGPAGAAENFRHGGFTPARGARSKKVLFFDDMGCGQGSTFQLGDRSGRLLRIYAKGQQLGDVNSAWTRYEVQYMGAEFGLSLDHLRNPGTLLTQYPDLEFLPVDGTGDAAMRVQREAEISVERVVAWATTTCGAVLTLLSESVGCTTTAELLHNDKTPKRLRRLADSRSQLAGMLGDALLDARKFAPIARTSTYLSAETRNDQ